MATGTINCPDKNISTAAYDSNANTAVYKIGNVCYIACLTGSWFNSGAGAVIRQGSSSATGWRVPDGFRPIRNAEIRDVLNGKRVTIDASSGDVTCTEALSGVALRFSGCYITP